MIDRDTNLIPPEGDPDVGKKVFKILESIIRDKENLGLTGPDGIWTRNHELVHGRHWRKSPSKKVPLVTVNLIKDNRVRTVNELTDNNPTFNAVLVGNVSDEQKQAFQILPKICENWWNETEQQDKLDSSVSNNEEYGVTIEKMVFDDEQKHGIGEAKTVIVDPFMFGWWPLNLADISELQSSEAVIYYYPVPVRKARRLYPQFADTIKPDGDEYDDAIGAERREISSLSGKSTGTGGIMTSLGSTVVKLFAKVGIVGEEGEDQVLFVECWCKDYSTVKDANGNDRPKYTGHIRQILTCNDGKNVLEDRSNPNINPNLPEELAQRTYLYDKLPFFGANSVKNSTNAWGEADIQQLEQLNMEIDKAVSQFVLEKDRAVRRKVINPKTSGVKNTEFTNINGIINPVNSNEAAAIRYLDYPQLPADILEGINLFKELFFRVAGSFEMDQRQVGGKDVVAYRAIAILNERVATMKRGKIRAVSRLIRERGRMYTSMVQNFYTEERYVAYQNEDGEDTVQRYSGSEIIIPAQISVVTGSTMPVSQVQRREEARELYKEGAIDQEELLARMEWPNAKEVIDRRNKGVYGKLFDKLGSIGVPPALLDLFNQVALLDDKKFAQEVERGEIPNFEQLMINTLRLMQQGGAGQQQPDPEQIKAMAEVGKIAAETKKVEAEAALAIEKIATERISQQVSLAGVRYDEEELKIRRAELVANIQREIKAKIQEDAPATKKKPGVYHESGMKSNNEEVLD